MNESSLVTPCPLGLLHSAFFILHFPHTYLVVLFHIRQGLFLQVFSIQSALLVQVLALFIESGPLAVAYPLGKGGVARPLMVGNYRALFELRNIALDSPGLGLRKLMTRSRLLTLSATNWL